MCSFVIYIGSIRSKLSFYSSVILKATNNTTFLYAFSLILSYLFIFSALMQISTQHSVYVTSVLFFSTWHSILKFTCWSQFTSGNLSFFSKMYLKNVDPFQVVCVLYFHCFAYFQIVLQKRRILFNSTNFSSWQCNERTFCVFIGTRYFSALHLLLGIFFNKF